LSRDLDAEYELLKRQYYAQGILTADQYLRGIREIAEAYDEFLRESGLIPTQPLEVFVDV